MFWKRFPTFIYIFFLISFWGDRYVVFSGTVVTEIPDMHLRKHNLHFLVNVYLLLHVFVNIPDEKMHIGVVFSHFYEFFF
jgi:hypothetical protein